MGQLPQQLDANLRILERLQEQLRTTSESITTAEDRNIIFQNQIENLKNREPIQTSQARRNSSFGQEEPDNNLLSGHPLVKQLNTLKGSWSVPNSDIPKIIPM